ncbi:GMC family oxidoreductase [Corynebacterium liangguodongii]|uniref:Choline oxidase n=1 Tax=Corynebacterium liangguodongii TaxID=2079535 RepID=A0A2S0WGD6_9CORY|nr:GMC family oxidoreductase N-terminal domain-containing protein [Corynebacterium liangguodongii]AWB84837.1 choline oxidase [Corynebacterium liangguodongii]PWB99194.1 choline oxidase [Corynebacterium liangguodongii]
MRDSYDYIVVGGGSTGAVIAARLSEDPSVTVALLEAGPDDADCEEVLSLKRWPDLLESGLDWDYPVEPQENGNSFMRHARARVLGGCSSHNSCIAFHPPAEDLQLWEKLGATGWGPNEILPLIKRMESNSREGDDYGHEGPVELMDVPQTDKVGLSLLDACEQAGIPRRQFNTGETVTTGADFFQISSHADNTRSSSSVSYLHPIRDRENLDILTDTWATRVLFDGTEATGVEYRKDMFNRKASIRAEREVIISAGAINSPQLLMLSGIGPKEHLESFGIEALVDSPGVGSNLQDHPEVVIQFETNVEMVRDSTQWWEIGIFAQIDADASDAGLPDVMMHYGSTPFDMHTARAGYPFADEAFALTPNVTHARSRGTVRLRSADYRDKPRVDPRYFTDPEGYDMHIAVEGIKLARKIASQPALAGVIKRELSPGPGALSDADIAAYITKTHNTVYHPAGTVRMGSPDDELSPLDPDLRVKGVHRLRVADASVMPQLTAVNPNITCYLIGERAAQLIAGAR